MEIKNYKDLENEIGTNILEELESTTYINSVELIENGYRINIYSYLGSNDNDSEYSHSLFLSTENYNKFTEKEKEKIIERVINANT